MSRFQADQKRAIDPRGFDVPYRGESPQAVQLKQKITGLPPNEQAQALLPPYPVQLSQANASGPSTVGRSQSPEPTSAANSASTTAPVQFYREATIEGEPWRVGDESTMAIRQDSAVYGGRNFYADAGLIASSNSILAGQKSALDMQPGGETMEVENPEDATKKTLTRVEPTNNQNNTTGNDRASGMKWPQDCGLAANTVMQGSGRETEAHYNKKEVEQKTWLEKVWDFIRGKGGEPKEKNTPKETEGATYGTVYEQHRNRNYYSPQKMLNDIFVDVTGNNFDKAWEDYKSLSDEAREKFDQQVGLNQYAQAQVGQAYVIVSNKDEQIDQKVWNFHWGGVVMVAGGDSVTMENFAGSGEDAWDFQMYGPPTKEGQTFHEQQKSRTKHDGVTPEYGDNPTTIVASPTGNGAKPKS